MARIQAALTVLLLLAHPAAALVWGYDVEFRNETPVKLFVQLRQYHAPTFDENRPDDWSDELLDTTLSGELAPGESDTASFDDAIGGFWVVWIATNPESGHVVCSGEVDFTKSQSPLIVVLTPEHCGRKPDLPAA